MDERQSSKSPAPPAIGRGNLDNDASCRSLLWNARRPERYPAEIWRPRSVQEVRDAVRHARDWGLAVSPRGGGHHLSGVALQDGLVLDLAALDHLDIDATAHIAEVGPAVTGGALARELGRHGLAFPTGHCATVPISGFLLNSGIGWNFGNWGFSCFSVESIEVVTADGAVVRASEAENAEIFWAARGAGPEFFGIVTSYRLRLQTLPTSIVTGVWTYPLDAAAGFEAWIDMVRPTLKRNVELTVLMSSAPPPLAALSPKVVSVIATAFAESEAEAEASLAAIGSAAPAGVLAVERSLPTPFETLYAIMGQYFPEGRRYASDTYWSSARPRPILEALAARVSEAPDPQSFAFAVFLPPEAAASRLPDAAFSMRAPVFAACYAVWNDPTADAANLAWLRGTDVAMRPLALGHYVGEADLERPGRLRKCFSPEAWSKLQSLKRKYDPSGLFGKSNPVLERNAA